MVVVVPLTVKQPVIVKLPAAVVVTPAVPILVTPANVVMFGWLAVLSVPVNVAPELPIVAAFTVAAIIVPELVIAAVCVAPETVSPVELKLATLVEPIDTLTKLPLTVTLDAP